ncbi:hypothetical protein HEP87_52515 [Streptomyces sp. S1D4-11]|nr:hypothetical protein [Streptomyces sp. S1D4-11]QIZ00780.1 hypothetical protein HEP87_52515 [Streptomyces sp. S1D4-11]
MLKHDNEAAGEEESDCCQDDHFRAVIHPQVTRSSEAPRHARPANVTGLKAVHAVTCKLVNRSWFVFHRLHCATTVAIMIFNGCHKQGLRSDGKATAI